MPGKRRTKRRSSPLERFSREFASEHSNVEVRIEPSGEISVSDAISRLIEPYGQDADDLDSFRTLVSFACVAWNLSILPRQEDDQLMEELMALTQADVEDSLEMLALVNELMDRKNTFFPDVNRLIMDWKVTEQGEDFHIPIASTLEEKPARK